MAWVQDGPADADPVLMLHGEPSWSFPLPQDDPGEELAGYIVAFLGG
jgi:haloalkane dehalogenase